MDDPVFSANEIESLNDTPIIGILTQEIAHSLEQIYPETYKSYIAASYVKFVEGGGARVVPVWIGKDEKYYADVVNKTNGLLFPGGSTWFNQTDGYADAGVTLYKLVVELNNQGHYYPIFGTCLGMELLIYAAAGSQEYRAHCSAMNIALPLELKSDFQESKMFRNAPESVILSLQNQNITPNFHQFCLTEKNLTQLNIENDWKVVAVNKDKNQFEFVSAVESRRYPFFGVQFHPEKNIYEWIPRKGIPHTANAVKAAQYFAEMFVNEARKNNHKYNSREDEQKELIYNYPVTYTGKVNSVFEQCYLFTENMENKI